MPIREAIMTPLSKEFVQPEGFPDTPTVNARIVDAVARLRVRGVTPAPNPLVTAWQLHALIKVLVRKGVLDQKDVDDITYFSAWLQMNDLERLVDQPAPKIAVPTVVSTPNGH